MNQIVVVAILAVVWAVVLIPQYWRNRSETRPGDSVGAFRQQLAVLERTRTAPQLAATGLAPYRSALRQPAPDRRPTPPRRGSRSPARRRRLVVRRLLFAVAGSFALGFVPGLGAFFFFWLALVLAVALAGYLALLARAHKVALERRAKVRYLAPPRHHQPVAPLRRSGS